MPTASTRYVQSWRECGLNTDMALWDGFDPKRTFATLPLDKKPRTLPGLRFLSEVRMALATADVAQLNSFSTLALCLCAAASLGLRLHR
jgi:hypothetical protein